MLALDPREKALRRKIYETTESPEPILAAESTAMQDVQDKIYSKTGLLARENFSLEDLEYLYPRLPATTRKMMALCGRDDPSKVTMYDLKHSLISCEGADAAIKIEQAREIARFAVDMMLERLDVFKPVRLMELGSGLSDVSGMVWSLIMDNIGKDDGRLRAFMDSNGKKPMDLFEIVDVEFSETTGRTAEQLMHGCGRTNISVRYGPDIGDATKLNGIDDNTFDIVWSSLMLGAFGDGKLYLPKATESAEGPQKEAAQTPSEESQIPAAARAVIRQAYRVVRPGGVVVHTDFVFVAGRPGTPWAYIPKETPSFLDQIRAGIRGRQNGLIRVEHHPFYNNMSSFSRKTIDERTAIAFDHWAWFDGGDFAAWEMTTDMKTEQRYSRVEVRRYAGAPASIPLAVMAIMKARREKDKIDEAEYQMLSRHFKPVGVAFVMSIGTVKKEVEIAQ